MIKELFKMHIGLVKYLAQELPKKKVKEQIKLLISVVPLYFKELVRTLKSVTLIFDKDYQAKKKQFDKMQTLKVDLRRCLKMLQYVDGKMDKAGVPRWKRRQFWRDFYSHGEVRKDVFDELTNELEGLK